MTSKYSLWLVPAGRQAALLSALIRRLASWNGTPTFLPHVTLMGRIRVPEGQILAIAERLAGSSSPFQLTFSTPEGQEEYFRALYLPVCENRELGLLHEQACKYFHRLEGFLFFPHLSLLYGSLDSKIKTKLISEITREYPRRIQVNQLEVYKTEGPVEVWQKCGEFPLTGTTWLGSQKIT